MQHNMTCFGLFFHPEDRYGDQHASLMIPDGKTVYNVEYEGVKQPFLFSDNDEDAFVRGDLFLQSASQRQLLKVLGYYKSMSEYGEGPFYFDRNLAKRFKFEAQGKQATNCIHSILTILHEKGLIDTSFIESMIDRKYRPAVLSSNIDKLSEESASTEQDNIRIFDIYSNIIQAKYIRNPKNGKKIGLWIKNLNGNINPTELLQAEAFYEDTGYFAGTVKDLATSCVSDPLNIRQLFQIAGQTYTREMRFQYAQILSKVKHASLEMLTEPLRS